MPVPTKDGLFRTEEAAEYLGVATRTLANWRCLGGGPKFVRVGPKLVRYRREDLDDWLRARLLRSTSQQLQA